MCNKIFYLKFKFESNHAGDFEYLYSDDDGHYLSVRPGFHEDEYRFISKGDFHYVIQEYKEKHSGHIIGGSIDSDDFSSGEWTEYRNCLSDVTEINKGEEDV